MMYLGYYSYLGGLLAAFDLDNINTLQEFTLYLRI